MIKVGNLNDLIGIGWIDSVLNEVLTSQGMNRPREGERPQGIEGEKEWQKAIDAGYDPDAAYFQMFDKTNLKSGIPIFHTCGRNRHWWITKMMPGQFMPMHIDPHTKQETNVDRLWIPLQDFEKGHIFAYEDIVITNYKKADVYKYNNPRAFHGAANIGSTPRIVLQVTLYEE